MITHIVFITFKPENKAENALETKRRIEAMRGKVESLRSMEVGINFTNKERAMDLALTASFDDCAGLEAYATHPVHLKVIEFIQSVAEYTKVVDYEN